MPPKFGGGLPLRKVNNPRTPGRGKGPRGPTINPEDHAKRTAAAARAKTKNQTKRPLVGK